VTNNETYTAIHIGAKDDILLGLLTRFDFESFEEEENKIIAYIRKSALDETLIQEIVSVISPFTKDVSFFDVEPQNWNALWEASFQPVIVSDFCQVRADFHPPEEGIQYDLIINPRMAFGTGHHATTYMMIDHMSTMDIKNKTVFDFGCGTGILAILASKMGAARVDALDIEHESYLNTVENAHINLVENINVFEGEWEVMPHMTYDIILANINRNVLTRYAGDLYDRLSARGQLLLSGVLQDDEDKVMSAFHEQGFQHKLTLHHNGWVCMEFMK
jgi:ribosomal protein L11 methyltransferase